MQFATKRGSNKDGYVYETDEGIIVFLTPHMIADIRLRCISFETIMFDESILLSKRPKLDWND